MNILLWVLLEIAVLRASLWCFQTLDEPAIGTAFIGLFFVGLLVTIKQAIDDYTGRGDQGEKSE